MSAYRNLSAEDLENVRRMAGADAGVQLAAQPIIAGIENSNWFLPLTHGGRTRQYVLTLVEAVPADELPFFVALTDALAEADLPVPMALHLADGRRQFTLQGRAALLVPRLPGAHVDTADAAQCAAVGALLAHMHNAARHCAFRRERPDHLWWPTAFAWLAPTLPRDTHDRLAHALLAASRLFSQAHALRLPTGIIHGDLFRDNVLFAGREISGVLDFFHATHDVLAWDIAIALNDWAVVNGTPDAGRAAAFIDGYESVRRLTTDEATLLPGLRRAAAARFWLSRLVAAERQRDTAGTVQRKDPAGMAHLLGALGG